MTLLEKTDVAEISVVDLSAGLQGKPRIASIVYAFGVQLQELETAIFDVIEDRALDVATNAQLEALGRIVGEPRYGRTDTQYRLAIRGRILANRSNGNWSDLLKLLELMRSGESYTWWENQADIVFFSESTDHDLDRIVLDFLRDASGAGVTVNMVAPATSADSFEFGDVAFEPEDGTTTGLSSTTEPALGGELGTTL